TAPDPLVASAAMSAGTVRSGAVESTTVTSKGSFVVLPVKSVPAQWTVVVPSANVEPETGEQPKDGDGSTRSVADAGQGTAAPDALLCPAGDFGRGRTVAPDALVAWAVMSAGSVRLGPAESLTVTTNEPGVVRPAESVTKQATVLWPSENVVPDAGVQVGNGSGSSSTSLAPTTYRTVAPAALVASTVIGPGSDSEGGAFTTTSTVKLIAVVPVRPLAPRRT